MPHMSTLSSVLQRFQSMAENSDVPPIKRWDYVNLWIWVSLWLDQQSTYNRSNVVWFLRMSHEKSHGLAPTVLTGALILRTLTFHVKVWLPWSCHAMRKPKAHGEAMCRFSGQQSWLRSPFKSCQSRPWHMREEASRPFQPTAVLVTPSYLNDPSWDPRHHEAGMRHPQCALSEFLTHTICEHTRWWLLYATQFWDSLLRINK